MLEALNFKKWIDDHRDLLKPPVGNQCVWKDRDFIVMVVGGPNARKDYHLNEGEEFFHQIEGDITLKIVEDGKHRAIPIRQGDIFLLPARVPHSPQRPANTIGMVVERKRRPGELDGLVWYCEGCQRELYKETFALVDIVAQLKAAMEGFWADTAKRTCKHCGAVLQKPEPAKASV